jgi:uncharacterized protein
MNACGQTDIRGCTEGANRIVYLHGFASGPGSNKARFFRERLERGGGTVQVPDLAAGDFEHLTITGQLALLREQVGKGPVDLIGSSMGGYLAALFAARHSAVRRVVLLAPAFGFAHGWAEQLGEEKVDQWRRTGWMEVFHYAYGEPRRLSYALLEDAAQYEDYPDFHQPARIFHGSHDDVVPPEHSAEFAAAHPNACLEVLDSGHELLNVLDDIGPKVDRFLFG